MKRAKAGRIERAYAWFRVVSFDVVLAALAGGLLAIRVVGAAPHAAFFWLLPTGVWVAYTLDHLLDARKLGHAALTPRHRFHHEHAKPLWIAVLLLSLLCAIGGWVGLSTFGLIYGGIMCALVAGHELLVKLAGNRASPLLLKEFGVAVVFTVGVWGMPWLRHRLDTGRTLGWPVVVMLQYLLLAVVNLIEFSIYESKIDTAQGQSSFVRGIGRRRAGWMALIALLMQVPMGITTLILHPTRTIIGAEAIYVLMAIGLLIVLKMPRFAARFERYRTLGDGVFLLPLLIVLLPA